MNTFAVIFSAEFVRRVRSRAFIVSTLFVAVAIAVISMLPTIFERSGGILTRRIVLVAPPALAAPALRLLRANGVDVVATLPRLDGRPTLAFLDAHRRAGAVVEVFRTPTGLRVVAYARDPSTFPGTIARDLAPLQIALDTGTPVATVAAHEWVPLTVHDVAGRFADAGAVLAARGIGLAFVMLLYLTILLNVQAIIASVAEEKTSRIAELLVAAVDPAQLLTAKIAAVTATSVIQIVVWIATGYFTFAGLVDNLARPRHGDVTGAALATIVPASEVVLLIAFFVIGFAQFSVLAAAAASLISRTEDLGSLTAPVVLPIVGAIFIAQFGLQFPGSPAVVVSSFVPLLAPFVMFTRIAVSPVPVWQIAVSLAINLVVAIVLALVAGRVYRIGLLLYGRPPSLRQIVATLRA